MAIYQVLQVEHFQIDEMISEIESTRLLDSSEIEKFRLDLFAQLFNELMSHMTAEEEVFYSRLRELGPLHEVIMDSLEEHHVVRIFLNELKDMRTTDPTWMSKFRVLRNNIHQHLQNEEHIVFEIAQRILPKEEATDAALRFDIRKNEILQELNSEATGLGFRATKNGSDRASPPNN